MAAIAEEFKEDGGIISTLSTWYDRYTYPNMKLEWGLLINAHEGPSEPLTREFIETKLIRNFRKEDHEEHVHSISQRATKRLPKYPQPRFGIKRPCHNSTSSVSSLASGEDSAYFYTKEQVEETDPQRRITCLIHRQKEGSMLSCVECRGQYIVVLVSEKAFHIYTNEFYLADAGDHRIYLDAHELISLNSRSLPKFVKMICEFYISLMKVHMFEFNRSCLEESCFCYFLYWLGLL